MRHFSSETREKMRASAKARGIKPPSRKGANHTLETRKKMSITRTKHGKSPLIHRIRNSYEMKEWKKSVFERDNYACQLCGDRCAKGNTVYIQADHFPVLFSRIINDEDIKTIEEARSSKKLWDISNGRTLCVCCHRLETSKLYKKHVIISNVRVTLIS